MLTFRELRNGFIKQLRGSVAIRVMVKPNDDGDYEEARTYTEEDFNNQSRSMYDNMVVKFWSLVSAEKVWKTNTLIVYLDEKGKEH